MSGLRFFLEQTDRETDTNFLKISYLLTDSEHQLMAKYENGPYVLLPVINSYSEIIDSLGLILNKYRIEGKNLKKVDLRFNNPVVEY